MNKKIIILSSLALLSLVSCAEGESIVPAIPKKQASLNITNSNVTSSTVYASSDVTVTRTLKDFEKQSYFSMQYTPSIGDVNLLVLPILLPGAETIDLDGDGIDDKATVINDLNSTFFGGTSMSVREFYEESSFNKLHFDGTVYDTWFDASTLGYSSYEEIDANATVAIANAAIDNYRENSGDDMSKYDYDKDGFLDGVWFIYSAHNYTYNQTSTSNTNLWAYTTWIDLTAEGDTSDPVLNLIGWASYDFMYDAGVSQNAHTFIHEMGHFLGLQDYYSIDNGGLSYSPVGKFDMMDANVLDHNNYSKMLLGWVTPTLVYGDATVALNFISEEDSLVVIQSDDAEVTNSFDPFGEYILIEGFTNEGLNTHDIQTGYNGLSYPSEDGVQIYHIDKRLYEVTSDMTLVEESEGTSGSLVSPITNSRDYDNYNYYFNYPLINNLFDEIRLIESSGHDTFSSGGYQKNESYFHEGDIFSLASHDAFFVNQKFNNEKTCSYEVEVTYL